MATKMAQPLPNPIPAYLRSFAECCKERSVAAGYRGYRRDDFVLDYFAGILTALDVLGEEAKRDHIARLMMMSLPSRGFSEVERWIVTPIKEDDNPA